MVLDFLNLQIQQQTRRSLEPFLFRLFRSKTKTKNKTIESCVQEPNKPDTDYYSLDRGIALLITIVTLERNDLKMLTGFLAGHFRLKEHLKKFSIVDPLWNECLSSAISLLIEN